MSLALRPVKCTALTPHRPAPPPAVRRAHPLAQRCTYERTIALRANHCAIQTFHPPRIPPVIARRHYSTTPPSAYEETIKGIMHAFARDQIDFSLCVTGCVMEAVKDFNGDLSFANQKGVEHCFQDFKTAIDGIQELSTTEVEILTSTYQNTLHEMIKEKWIHQIAKEFNPIFKINHPEEKARAAVEWIDAFFAGVKYFGKGNPYSENLTQLRDLVVSISPRYERNLLSKCVWFGHIFHLYNTPTEAQIRLLAKNFQNGELS